MSSGCIWRIRRGLKPDEGGDLHQLTYGDVPVSIDEGVNEEVMTLI